MTPARGGLFIDVATDLLVSGHRVRFRAPGSSMAPAIGDGDAITVEPVRPDQVRRGAVVVYRAGRRVIAHRVVGIENEAEAAPVFILRGDAAGFADERVEPGQILGRVTTVEREGWGARLFSAARRGAERLVVHPYPARRAITGETPTRLGLGRITLALLLAGLSESPADTATPRDAARPTISPATVGTRASTAARLGRRSLARWNVGAVPYRARTTVPNLGAGDRS